MKKPIYSNLISGLLNVLVCITAATLILISQDWLGKGDLYAFVFWTIPPVAGLSVCGISIIRLIRFKNLFFRILTIIGLSVLISFAWIYCVYLFLGPWINTFSFPSFIYGFSEIRCSSYSFIGDSRGLIKNRKSQRA